MFPPLQLPVDNHAVNVTDAGVFFLWALSLLCRDINSFSYVFCWSFSLPQWHLQCHLTSHHVNSCCVFFFVFFLSWEMYREAVGLSMWQWLINGINTRKIWETPLSIFCLKCGFFVFSSAVALSLWTTAGSGFGISQSSRLSSSVSAMRVLNTGSDVEEALADALVWQQPFPKTLHLKKKKKKHT